MREPLNGSHSSFSCKRHRELKLSWSVRRSCKRSELTLNLASRSLREQYSSLHSIIHSIIFLCLNLRPKLPQAPMLEDESQQNASTNEGSKGILQVCHAATTLQPPHYSHLTTATTLQPLHYSHYTTATSLQPPHYNHHTTATTLQPPHYNHHTTATTLQPPHYSHHTTATTLQPPHYSHHTTATTLQPKKLHKTI